MGRVIPPLDFEPEEGLIDVVVGVDCPRILEVEEDDKNEDKVDQNIHHGHLGAIRDLFFGKGITFL